MQRSWPPAQACKASGPDHTRPLAWHKCVNPLTKRLITRHRNIAEMYYAAIMSCCHMEMMLVDATAILTHNLFLNPRLASAAVSLRDIVV